jgi:hypothetical protein
LPQSSLAPRHCRHIQAGGASMTSMDLATFSSSPVTLAGSTVDSHATLFGRPNRNPVGALDFLKCVGRDRHQRETSAKLCAGLPVFHDGDLGDALRVK